VIELLTGSIAFAFLVGGLGLPWATRFPGEPSQRFCIGLFAGCITLYLAAFLIYWLKLPQSCFVALPVFATALLITRLRGVIRLVRDTQVTSLVLSWLNLCGWCLGLLAYVRSYSGGEWTGDWIEHYQRTQFFLDRWPLDTRFIGIYTLPARPPLANLVLGACMALTGNSFVYFQVFIALFSTLTFFPLALWARQFRRPWAGDPAPIIAILLILNPMFVQNVTFAWTKLLTASFVLGGLYFAVNNDERAQDCRRIIVASLCFAAALLTHYSAAPYIIAIVVVLAVRFRVRSRSEAQRLATALVPSFLLAATWFIWSIWHYGRSTYSANTAMAYTEGTLFVDTAIRRLHNLVTLIIPHPLRGAEYQHIAQDSALGAWRDFFFNLYQTNLFFAFGTGGLIAVAALIWNRRRQKSIFWAPFVLTVIGLNAAVISWPDRWGSAHIGLHAMIFLGLAWVAGNWGGLSRALRHYLVIGLVIDAIFGIGLQFYLQHSDLSELYPDFRDNSLIHVRGFATWANFYGKSFNHLEFLADQNFPAFSHGVILALTLAMAVYRARSVGHGSPGYPPLLSDSPEMTAPVNRESP
jgi:hypothetical protein